MKKVMTIVAVSMFILVGSVVYAGQFGPPEPAAKEGKAALGIGYFYYSAKYKPKDTVNFREFKGTQNQVYLQASYGFIKNGEIYLRVGGADAKGKNAFSTSGNYSGFKSDFKDGFKPFGTIGVKGVFNVSPSFGIGPFLQASLFSDYKDKTSGTYSGSPATQEEKGKEQREINIGVGLQGKIGEAILYGGPVIYWAKHKVDWTLTTGGVSYPYSTTYKEKNNLGGFAGLRIPLSKSLNLEVEGQLKSRFSMGGALTYAF